MKRKLSVLGCSASITALLVVLSAFSQNTPKVPATDSRELVTVLNPAVASKMAERLPLAPRLATLEGKTIYMVDINWGGPEAALSIFEEMQAWFARTMPGVKTVIKMKRGGYEADDPALWKEIKEGRGDGVILGVSG
jgi:hypothetical protein